MSPAAAGRSRLLAGQRPDGRTRGDYSGHDSNPSVSTAAAGRVSDSGSDGSDGLEAAAEVEDDSPSAFELVGGAQDAARLGHCLDELEERSRAMIRAAFLDGATYPELAQREGVPLGTMKSWIRRGLQRLRGCLER